MANSVPLKDFRQRDKNYLDVPKERNFVYILNIILEFLFPRDGITTIHLSPPAKARANIVTMFLFFVVTRQIFYQKRSRADYGHITLQYVEEFRKFVEACAAEELAVAGEAHFVGQEFAVSVGLAGHGAELDELEDLLVLPGTQLREEGIPLHLDGSQNRKHDENRAQADDGQKRAEKVDDTFEEVPVHLGEALLDGFDNGVLLFRGHFVVTGEAEASREDVCTDIAILVVALIVGLASRPKKDGSAGALAGAGSAVRIPIQGAVGSVVDWMQGIYGYIYRYDKLMAENESLRQQLAAAQEEARAAAEAAEENVRLRMLLGYLEKNTSFVTEAAMITAASATSVRVFRPSTTARCSAASRSLTTGAASSSSLCVGMADASPPTIAAIRITEIFMW